MTAMAVVSKFPGIGKKNPLFSFGFGI